MSPPTPSAELVAMQGVMFDEQLHEYAVKHLAQWRNPDCRPRPRARPGGKRRFHSRKRSSNTARKLGCDMIVIGTHPKERDRTSINGKCRRKKSFNTRRVRFWSSANTSMISSIPALMPHARNGASPAAAHLSRRENNSPRQLGACATLRLAGKSTEFPGGPKWPRQQFGRFRIVENQAPVARPI